MLKLYSFPGSGNCYKCALLLAQLGIECEEITVDILAPGGRPEEFASGYASPKVPRIELDDGTLLAESGAILWYFAEGTPFLPDAKLDRARVLQWMFFEQNLHEPFIATARFWLSLAPDPGPREQVIPFWQEKGNEALALMDAHLEDNEFFAAGKYTIADMALYAYTHCADEGGFELGRYPNVEAWLALVREQPGYVAMRR